jgi:hypothetical protein
MRKCSVALLFISSLFMASPATSLPVFAKPPLSDAQVKQRIIRESIASYPGNCPCPYNTTRNGSSCGGRSAWSRKGGYAPLCYVADVNNSDVQDWRSSH